MDNKNKLPKSMEELNNELQELQQKYDSLKAAFEKGQVDNKEDELILRKLIYASEQFIQFTGNIPDYHSILQMMLDISGAKYAALNIFDENGHNFTTVAIAGINENIKKASSLLGYDIINKHWKRDLDREAKTKVHTITRFEHLCDLAGNVLSKNIIRAIEKVFGIQETFVVKTVKNNVVLGDFTLLYKTGETIKNHSLVELYAHQTGIFLDRNKVTNSLRESEEKYRVLFETLPVGVTLTDVNGNIIESNSSAEKILGLSAAQSEQRKIDGVEWSIIRPDHTPMPSEEYASVRALKEGKPIFDIEMGVTKGINEIAWILVNAAPIPGFGVVISYEDITEKKKAENLISQIRKNYETFFNTINDFLFVLNEQGNIIHTNNTVIDRLGYTQEELAGLSVLLVHPPERREEAGRIVGEMLSGVSEFCPVPIVTKSGVQIPVETRVSHGIWDGKPAIFGVTKDISALRLSEEKFSKLFHVNPSACGLSGLDDGRYYEVNEAFYTLFGFDKEEVIGKTASELGILTTEAISAIMMKADSHGNVTNAEADLIAKNGNIKQVLLSSENIFVQNKKFRYTVVNDVTELKKVQESLRESSQKFEAIVSASPDGIGMVTLDGKIQLMSKKLALMYGSSIQEIEGLMGRSIFDFIDVSNHQLLIENMGKLLEGDKDQPITEYQAIKKDNSRFYVDVNSAVLLDSGGNPASVLFVQRDITERKQNEESLKQVTMRLSLAAIAGGVGIWDYDLVNNNLLWDDQMFALYGVDKEHFGGAYNAWLDGVHPDDTARGDEEIQMAISGEKDFNTEFRVLWPDGTIRHIRALAIVQRDDSGNPLRMIGTNWDITAQKHNEQTLRMSEETLRKINADKDKLFSIIAHDLRSPFNGFLGFTDLLVQDLDTFTQEEIRNIAKSMSFSATNLFRLLENLLEWSRMQQGLIRFNCDEAQLLPIVHGSMSTVLEPAKNKGIELSYDIPEGLTIFADINMLLSVIRNLASNAVKFTPKGGKIIISAKVTGDHHVELSIRDSGIGMSSSMVENLFRLDVQTSRKGTEGEPSTGLGLILCKDFIEKHGGKIWVESEEGKGSTFRFTLPTLNQ